MFLVIALFTYFKQLLNFVSFEPFDGSRHRVIVLVAVKKI